MLKIQIKEVQASEKKTQERCDQAIARANHDTENLKDTLKHKISLAETQEFLARSKERDLDRLITEKAERIYSSKRIDLECEYTRKTSEATKRVNDKLAKMQVLTYTSLIYCILATLFTGCTSKRFSTDFIEMIIVVWGFITGIFKAGLSAASAAWALGNKIPYPYVAPITAMIIAVLTFILVVGGIFGVIGTLMYIIGKFYHEEFWDLIGLAESLITLIVFVWFADSLTMISWNLISLWIIIHIVYLLVRIYMLTTKESRGSYYY